MNTDRMLKRRLLFAYLLTCLATYCIQKLKQCRCTNCLHSFSFHDSNVDCVLLA